LSVRAGNFRLMPNPVLDTLFRSTANDLPAAARSALASAPPVRPAGGHTRAGNAMERTRAALLDGARRAVATSGTKITMAQVAAASGVAKATLYNHFRTREAVLAALLAADIRAVVDAVADLPLPQALAGAATMVSEHPVPRALSGLDPATLVRLATVDLNAAGWQLAHEAVRNALVAADRRGADTVLRWFASLLLNPASSAEVAGDVAALLDGLARRRVAPAPSQA
jgi:AcrR family transcriptional regulator